MEAHTRPTEIEALRREIDKLPERQPWSWDPSKHLDQEATAAFLRQEALAEKFLRRFRGGDA